MRRTLLTLLAAVLLAPPALAAKPSARWMAHCAGNLKGERMRPSVVRRYCACMAGLGDEPEMLTWSQTDLERSYPPAHRQCYGQARGRR